MAVKKKRRRRISRKVELRLKITTFFICLIVGGIFLWNNLNGENVKLSELTRVSLVGYDTKGSVKVELDAEMAEEEITQLQKVLDTVQIELSKEDNLTNGDEVQIIYKYDEQLAKELDIKIGANPTVFAVENLPQAEQIDLEELFADVSLVYEGISPSLKIKVKNESKHPYIKTMDFVIRDEKEYYEKGDTIKIDAVFSEEEAIMYRYAIEKGEDGYCKTFQIEDVDSYLTKAEQITEEALETLIEEGKKCFTDANEYGLRIFSEAGCMPIWVNKKTTFTWENPYVISVYFDKATEEGMELAGTLINDVKIVYGVTLTQANGVNCDAEIVVRFDGLMEKADGTLDLALDTGSMISASHKDKFIKDIVRNTYADEQYESERIL